MLAEAVLGVAKVEDRRDGRWRRAGVGGVDGEAREQPRRGDDRAVAGAGAEQVMKKESTGMGRPQGGGNDRGGMRRLQGGDGVSDGDEGNGNSKSSV